MHDLTSLKLVSDVIDGERAKPLRIDGTDLVLVPQVGIGGGRVRVEDAQGSVLEPLSSDIMHRFLGYSTSAATLRKMGDWVRENQNLASNR